MFGMVLLAATFLMHVDSVTFANFTNTNTNVWIVAEDGTGDFSTICEAISNDNVSPGDVIFVRAGSYAENIVVNKSISLIGENPYSTKICGDNTTGSVIYINVDDVKIINFTITGSGTRPPHSAIYVNSSNRITISYNRIIGNNNGISLYSSANDLIFGNIIENNSLYGVFSAALRNSLIINNTIVNNGQGITFYVSANNYIVGNDIKNSVSEGIYLYISSGNVIYHNNFQNMRQVWSNAPNIWDYSGEGNYWSDYKGSDFYKGLYQNETGGDGIGDEPYIIDEYNYDNFPLMGRCSFYNINFEAESYQLTLISNSTISNFNFTVGIETGNKIISFNVAGEDGSAGFCRVSIPTQLMNYAVIILVDYEEVAPTLLSSTETCMKIYLAYNHSVRTITIISSKALTLYNALLAEHTQLQEKFSSLNTSYYGLLNNFLSLLNDYQQLRDNYTDLYNFYNELLQKYNESSQNIQALVYAFITAITMFTVVTIYLSKQHA